MSVMRPASFSTGPAPGAARGRAGAGRGPRDEIAEEDHRAQREVAARDALAADLDGAGRGAGEREAQLDVAARGGPEGGQHHGGPRGPGTGQEVGVAEPGPGRVRRGRLDPGEAEILRGVGEEGVEALRQGAEIGVLGATGRTPPASAIAVGRITSEVIAGGLPAEGARPPRRRGAGAAGPAIPSAARAAARRCARRATRTSLQASGHANHAPVANRISREGYLHGMPRGGTWPPSRTRERTLRPQKARGPAPLCVLSVSGPRRSGFSSSCPCVEFPGLTPTMTRRSGPHHAARAPRNRHEEPLLARLPGLVRAARRGARVRPDGGTAAAPPPHRPPLGRAPTTPPWQPGPSRRPRRLPRTPPPCRITRSRGSPRSSPPSASSTRRACSRRPSTTAPSATWSTPPGPAPGTTPPSSSTSSPPPSTASPSSTACGTAPRASTTSPATRRSRDPTPTRAPTRACSSGCATRASASASSPRRRSGSAPAACSRWTSRARRCPSARASPTTAPRRRTSTTPRSGSGTRT